MAPSTSHAGKEAGSEGVGVMERAIMHRTIKTFITRKLLERVIVTVPEKGLKNDNFFSFIKIR